MRLPVVESQEWRFELRRRARDPEYSVRRVAYLQKLAQILDRGVVNAKPSPDAGPARSAKEGSEQAFLCPGRIGQPKSWGKGIVLDRRQRAGHPRIMRHQPACRRPGKDNRLHTRNDCLCLVLRVVPGGIDLVPQPVVERQAWLHPPAILGKHADILAAGIQHLVARLDEGGWRADEKVRKIHTGFCPVEGVVAIFSKEISFVDLIVVIGAAEFHAVRAEHFGKNILDLIGVVELPDGVRRNPDLVTVENDRRHTFECRVDRTDASVEDAPRRWGVCRAVRLGKAQGTEGGPKSPLRFEQVDGVPRVADVKFIHHGGAEGLIVTKADQLCPADGVSAEAWYSGSRIWIRVVFRVVVNEIVGGQKAEARVGVHAGSALVIIQDVVERRGGKETRHRISLWNIRKDVRRYG